MTRWYNLLAPFYSIEHWYFLLRVAYCNQLVIYSQKLMNRHAHKLLILYMQFATTQQHVRHGTSRSSGWYCFS